MGGWVTLDPESEYMQLIQPIQNMKKVLGSENFTALYQESKGGRVLAKQLADLIAEVSQEPHDRRANAFCFNYAALTGFAAAMLQPSYAKRFAHLSEDGIDRVMQAFEFKNCIMNSRYIALLKKNICRANLQIYKKSLCSTVRLSVPRPPLLRSPLLQCDPLGQYERSCRPSHRAQHQFLCYTWFAGHYGPWLRRLHPALLQH